MDNNLLRQAQFRMLDILVEIDRICKKNKIRYWLTDGTLLGAVRHKGFIPWDDDIDICMLEDDYNKFLEIAPKELDYNKYFMHSKLTDKHMKLNSAKVRDRNSMMIETTENDDEKQHQGLFVDIFPMVYIKNINKITYPIYRVITKCKDLSPYAGTKKKIKLILKYTGCIWLSKKIYKFFYSPLETNIIGYRPLYSILYTSEEIFPLKMINFEGHSFYSPNNSDHYLTKIYGDYMRIPEEKDRVWHAKEIKLNEKCNFEKNLEKIGKNLYD